MEINDIIKMFGKVDGELIIEKYFNFSKMEILLNRKKIIDETIQKNIEEDYKLYSSGYPLQYILGKWNFYGRDFYVKKDVLIPRFETEILIENILKLNRSFKNILELGIGTGIISLTLAMELENVNIVGVDISKSAIELSNRNKDKFNIKNIEFIESNLYSNVKRKFDLIVSNPPYINKEDMKKLDKKLSHEPDLALFGGEDGLYFYKNIIKDANKYLNKGGYIAFEIGYNQKEDIIELLKDNKFKIIETIKDYNGFDRCIIGQSII